MEREAPCDGYAHGPGSERVHWCRVLCRPTPQPAAVQHPAVQQCSTVRTTTLQWCTVQYTSVQPGTFFLVYLVCTSVHTCYFLLLFCF